MRRLLVPTALLLSLALVVLFFRFGTLHPCGMLKKELRAKLLQHIAEQPSGNEWAKAGNVLGVVMGGAVIDNTVDAFGPWQCGQRLIRLQSGEPIASQEPPSKDGQAKKDLVEITEAIRSFVTFALRYPTDEEGLTALCHQPPTVEYWAGPYLPTKPSAPSMWSFLRETHRDPPQCEQQLIDPWGHPYKYRFRPKENRRSYVLSFVGRETYDLLSLGADGKSGGKAAADDITAARALTELYR